MNDQSRDTLDGGTTRDNAGVGEGKVLADRYRMLYSLGEGGMGMVWLAEDTELGNERVAIKLIPKALSSSPKAIKSLKKEAQTSRGLSHNNIIRLHDLHTDGHEKFLVMEYVEGKTLESLLAEREDDRYSLEELLPIAEQVAAGLDYAHNRRVLHRDLKPANIMVDKNGRVVLLDFGIARQLRESMTQVTGHDTSGTLPYMSPQQLMGDQPDRPMDIYSLAAVLYECLAGHPPFYQGDIAEQIKSKQPPPIKDVAASVNRTLLPALSKSPINRPTSASNLVLMLSGKSKLTNLQAGMEESGRSRSVIKKVVLVLIAVALGAGLFFRDAIVEEARKLAGNESSVSSTDMVSADKNPIRPTKPASGPVQTGSNDIPGTGSSLGNFVQGLQPVPESNPGAVRSIDTDSSAGAVDNTGTDVDHGTPSGHGVTTDLNVDTTPGAIPAIKDEFTVLMEQAKAVETAGQWETAISIYEQAQNIRKTKDVQDALAGCRNHISRVHSSRAEKYESEGQLREAVKSYLLALEFEHDASVEEKVKTLQARIASVREKQAEFENRCKRLAGAERSSYDDFANAIAELRELRVASPGADGREELDALRQQIVEEILAYVGPGLIEQDSEVALKAIKLALQEDPGNAQATAVKLKLWNAGARDDYENSVKMRFVEIAPGEFEMGSPLNEDGGESFEWPRHTVRITRWFFIGTTEVTQEQWRAVMTSDPSAHPGDNRPVENVSWHEAVDFCHKLSELEGLKYRLPTEAEWEYVCRAGTKTAYSTGNNGVRALRQVCWCSFNNIMGSALCAKPVGHAEANRWGMYDMHGNLLEWCYDWYEGQYADTIQEDPAGPAISDERVLRGGSWYHVPAKCRSAARLSADPKTRDSMTGFRVVIEQ